MMKDSLWIREASGTKLVIPIKTPTGQQTSWCQRHIHRCLSANDFRSEWSQFGRLRLSPMGTMSWSALPFKAHGRLPIQLQISCSKWSKKVEVRVLPASLRNYLMALKNIILCASVFLIFYLLLLRRIQGRQVLDGQAIFWINFEIRHAGLLARAPLHCKNWQSSANSPKSYKIQESMQDHITISFFIFLPLEDCSVESNQEIVHVAVAKLLLPWSRNKSVRLPWSRNNMNESKSSVPHEWTCWTEKTVSPPNGSIWHVHHVPCLGKCPEPQALKKSGRAA